ncbi:MAG: DUF1501 domain-containing protein [Pyrinomonadaceae bacterium]
MKQNRRDFLIKSGCALGMTAAATQFRHFGMMSAMAQKVSDESESAVPSDYRALVCIFMSGGNDSNNVVIPNHSDASLSNYTTYFNARNTQGLALAQNTLLPISVPRMGNLSYGLHPNLGVVAGGTNNGIHELWGLGKMAIVTNVGTLVQPTTRAQYQTSGYPKPYQLFSHSDQVSQYQGGRSDQQSFTGWGGRLSDQRTQPDNPNGLIPMVTSINGAQLFTSGQTTLPMAIAAAPTGLNQVLAPAGFNTTAQSQARLAAFNQLRTQDLSSDLVKAASHVTDQAIQANTALATPAEVTVTFPNTTLGNQLKQVGRLIKKRGELTVNRQIFYCQIGGFDTHSNQTAANGQTGLMTQLSQAMRAFYEEMVVQGLADKVTMFTMSDFARTFSPTGTGGAVGTDHAWAGHHFIVGGAITASDFYGINTSNGTPFPTLTMNGPDDSDNGTGARGRWIPTTSVEQYAATLSRWYGLPDANLIDVFPKIANFPVNNLGFMQA